jgi:hypothetical protein
MPPSERPILVLPAAVKGGPLVPRRAVGGGPRNPKKARQIERLSPRFSLLETALEEKRLALQAGAAGVSPEQVLVFETNGPIAEFLEAVQATPGLSSVLEESLADLDPDGDFHHLEKDKTPSDKKVSARVYLVMTNQGALGQLLSLWSLWKAGKRRIAALTLWSKVFRRLRDVRRWGAKDRLEETGILADWSERVQWGGGPIPVEVELWFRTEQEQTQAEKRVADLVRTAGGQVLRRTVLPEIGYHGMLVTLPRSDVEGVLGSRDIAVVAADDIRFFRPVPQMRRPDKPGEATEHFFSAVTPGQLRRPVVALLDGLPMENHALLRDRLVVDDPDGFAANYPVARRDHGTAMASLILHGDLLSNEAPSERRLYVRPILRPDPVSTAWESAPADELWLDLVHRAVRRLYEEDASGGPAAIDARIINFSIGDGYQPYLNSISPIARLVDWLSWKYSALFVISAGNHSEPLKIPVNGRASPTEAITLRALHGEHRHRRLLAPAEAINAITVGALHEDLDHSWTSASQGQVLLLRTPGLPSPFSGLGRGHRRAVKPDVLSPGGRAIFNRLPDAQDGQATFEQAFGPKLPGQRAAAPGSNASNLSAIVASTGTSNAAALTSRLAERVHDALILLQRQTPESSIGRLPIAVLVKAMLVHTADWNQGAFDILAAALRTAENATNFRDMISAYLGYGQLRPERAAECTQQRVTFIGGGFASPGDQWLHSIPLPRCLHAQNVKRRLTITLAWFTPINPRVRGYRCLNLSFVAPKGQGSPLDVMGKQVHGNAVSRGTVQHEVFENAGGAMDVPLDASIEIPVTCLEDAPLLTPLPKEGVPYALALSLEVAPEISLPIYDEVQARVQPAVRVRV